MRKYLKICTIASLLFYSCTQCPFFRWITVLSKENQSGQRNQHVLCYADFHLAFYRDFVTDSNHLMKIRSIINSCKPDDCKFIVEDHHDYQGSNPLVKSYKQVENSGRRLLDILGLPPLFGLAAHCREKGFDVSNVECRVAREMALRPFLCPSSSGIRWDIPVKDLVTEFEETVKIVQHYDDGPDLNAYYHDQLNNFMKVSKDLREVLRGFEIPLSKFAEEHIPPSKRLAFAINFLHWDSSLLDMQAVHEVVTEKDKKKIALFMGAAHIFPVTQALMQHGGYKHCKTIGTEQWYGCDPVTSFDLDQLRDEATINAQIEANNAKIDADPHKALTTDDLEVLLEDIPSC